VCVRVYYEYRSLVYVMRRDVSSVASPGFSVTKDGAKEDRKREALKLGRDESACFVVETMQCILSMITVRPATVEKKQALAEVLGIRISMETEQRAEGDNYYESKSVGSFGFRRGVALRDTSVVSWRRRAPPFFINTVVQHGTSTTNNTATARSGSREHMVD